ncbi:MAG TPA: TIGR02147 family protein [Chitinivibrionales bacterium]|nr:TIGR02147 family protein [Chitinivibrionales bacterium]
MSSKNIKIFEYTDYRFFLKDYYSFQKKNNRRFSYRSFAIQSGVAPSLFKDVVSGRRQLTLKVMEKYAAAMQMSPREQSYFKALVEFVNAKNNQKKNEAFGRMMQLRRHIPLTFLDEKQYEFFSNWYYSAIRELISLPEFREDPEWIAKAITPPITAGQAKKALEVLLHLKLVNRNANGRLELSDTVVSSRTEMNSMLLRNFHHSMIQIGQEALERFDPQEREISSLTLGVSNASFENIKQRIKSFKEEILNVVVEDKTDSQTVCQLNFQLFPLVAKGKKQPPADVNPENPKVV